MFYLVGKHQLLKNLASLLQSQDKNQSDTIEDLRSRYINFINKYQPEVPRSELLGPEILGSDESEKLAILSKIFTSQDSILTDFKNSSISCYYDKDEIDRYKIKIWNAIQYLKIHDPDFYNFFNLTITD